MKRNTLLIVVEIVVIGGILFGWIAPLLFPSEEPEQSKKTVETLPATSAPSALTSAPLCV
ncbi:MAG: hypothetical protein RID09_21145 [Coleofasciculus sp. G1-WW12-02]|uniref:hypothetical protein n=1 Tax=Coleofasciculus sp. G1-WW12-02 TaxID=3068483 RepID=UPI0032FD2DC1